MINNFKGLLFFWRTLSIGKHSAWAAVRD